MGRGGLGIGERPSAFPRFYFYVSCRANVNELKNSSISDLIYKTNTLHVSALAFLGGVVALQQQSFLPDLFWVSALLAIVVACFSISALARSLRLKLGLFLYLIVVLGSCSSGFLWAQWRAASVLAERLGDEQVNIPIEVIGVVAALPQQYEGGQRFVFDVESAAQGIPDKLLLSFYPCKFKPSRVEVGAGRPIDCLQRVRPGQRWQFFVKLRRPHGNVNPGGFDQEARMLEQGIRAVGVVQTKTSISLLAPFVWRTGYLVERARDEIRERFEQVLAHAPYRGVIVALAVGDQRSIPSDQWGVFSKTGVGHLISISGLHVTMIAALFASITNFIWRRRASWMLTLPAQKVAIVIGALAAGGYSLLAGFEVPAQRTFFMLLVVAWALISSRNLNIATILSLALFIVLLIDPWAVLTVGFWLSFFAVAILVAFSLKARTSARPERSSRVITMLREFSYAQWAVTVGTLPLLLMFFQQLSLVSPVANAVAIPVVSLIVAPLALLAAIVPWEAPLLLAHEILSYLMKLLEWLASFPLWEQPAPSVWVSLLAISAVFVAMLPVRWYVRCAALLALMPIFFAPKPVPEYGGLWLDTLDVGQGLAVVVRTHNHVMLYDTAAKVGAESGAAQRIILPFLRYMGVRSLDRLVVSHQDNDHSGGVQDVLNGVRVDHVLTSMPLANAERCYAGQKWYWDGVLFEVLYPFAADYDDLRKSTNSMSCVLLIEAQGKRFFLAGDIEARDEKRLLAAYEMRPVEVLVVPHHGGKYSSSSEFVATLLPKHAVFSSGYLNHFGHPALEVLARYSQASLWRTDQDGAIQARVGGPSFLEVTSWRQLRHRYWFDP